MISQTFLQLIESPLSAFLFFTLCSLILSQLKHTSIKLIANKIGYIATYLMLFAAALSLGMYAFQVLEAIFTIYNLQVTGSYWYALWYYPVVLILVQLLWFKKLRNITGIRLLAGILLLISPQIIEILLSSLKADFTPSGWSLKYYSIGSAFINSVIITAFFIGIWMFFEHLYNNKSNLRES